MKYVALLRAINVGGNRIVPMAKLREVFEGAGATDVKTYIQSGNVVFAHAGKSAAKLAAQLATAIEQATKLAVPVVLRTAAEWAQVIERAPYADVAHLHCAFLPAVPSKFAFDAAPYTPEQCALVGRELYLLLPNGIGNSKLAGAAIPKDATTRNWRTVLKLHALAS